MTSRDDWIAAGLAALSAGGEQAIRIDPLAARLGVTKGSFHHHFRGVSDLRHAVLSTHEQNQLSVVEKARGAATELDPTSAISLLERLIAELPDQRLERAVRAWAVTDATAASVQDRIDAARLATLESLWRQAVPPAVARSAALIPLLMTIGASASTVASRAELRSALALLANLAEHVPGTAAGVDAPDG